MTDIRNQQTEFFKKMETKIIESATDKIRNAIEETFTKQWYSTEGIIGLIDTWYGEYIASNLDPFVRLETGCRKGGIDWIKIMDALIHHGFGEQVTHHIGRLWNDITLEKRKWLFSSLIKSEQGKVFLENIDSLYEEEHKDIVDMLLSTESSWIGREGEDCYDQWQTPLIFEYFEKLAWMDKAKTLMHLLKKWQFKAFKYSKEISQQLPSLCFGTLITDIISEFKIGRMDRCRPLFQWELDEEDRKDILSYLITEHDDEYDLYAYKNIEKFWASYEQVTQMIEERDNKVQ